MSLHKLCDDETYRKINETAEYDDDEIYFGYNWFPALDELNNYLLGTNSAS